MLRCATDVIKYSLGRRWGFIGFGSWRRTRSASFKERFRLFRMSLGLGSSENARLTASCADGFVSVVVRRSWVALMVLSPSWFVDLLSVALTVSSPSPSSFVDLLSIVVSSLGFFSLGCSFVFLFVFLFVLHCSLEKAGFSLDVLSEVALGIFACVFCGCGFSFALSGENEHSASRGKKARKKMCVHAVVVAS